MWNLVRFFVRNSPFFTWLFLSIAGIYLLGQNNPYHRSVLLGSANVVSGSLFEMSSKVTGYFGLRAINEGLLSRTGQLEAENLRLKRLLSKYTDEDLYAADTVTTYRYHLAHVISNSINLAANYITLNVGSVDGIKQDQGVADQNGVVGIVSKVSEHYCLVMSLLNPKFRLPVRLKNTDSFGSLLWDGKSHETALLEDFPRKVDFQKGDTIETTSFATSFPAGIPVGTVEDWYEQTANNNFLTLRIRLFTDFNRINAVHVISNDDADELAGLLKVEEDKEKK